MTIFFFFRKIWTQFMDFESTVGDLSSIKKVEKRVLASMTAMTDSNGEANQAAQLIERYKVFDLWPCSKEELIIYGLSDQSPVEKSSVGQYANVSKTLCYLIEEKRIRRNLTKDLPKMTRSLVLGGKHHVVLSAKKAALYYSSCI